MKINIEDTMQYAIDMKVSDIHFTVGLPPMGRVHGDLVNLGEKILDNNDTEEICKLLFTNKQYEDLLSDGEKDVSFSIPQVGRFRINAFKQRGSIAIAMRHIISGIPDFEQLGIPGSLMDLTNNARGLILVTGPTGSGKSTTLACMIAKINQEKKCHILTLEDPIEYLHRHANSIVNQREIGVDSKSYGDALRAALREDPDVILVGEMRDLETISIALTAAETGHLVFSTLHTTGAAKTIDRIIDVFPTDQQDQVRVQLSTVLISVISQLLIPRDDIKGRIAVFEIMNTNPAIRNLIRENKSFQIQSVMQTSKQSGMWTLDSQLLQLFKKSMISKDTLNLYCQDTDYISRMLI